MPAYGRPLAGLCASTAIFVCGAAGWPVLPDSLPDATGSLSLNGVVAVEAQPGDDLHLSGEGFAAQAAVTVGVYSQPEELVTTTADDDGAVTATVRVPEQLVGDHTVVAIGNAPDGDAVVLHGIVTVHGDASAAPPTVMDTLPRTGIRVGLLVLGSFGLIIAGFALLRSTVGRRPFFPGGS